jgi:hypothetical protein
MSTPVRSYEQYLYNSPASIRIEDGVVDYSNNTPLVGKFVNGYSLEYARAILWSIEHFAGPTPPSNHVVGQLWFDTSTTRLYVCESSSPPSYKIISAASPSAEFAGNHIIPSLDGTYNIGSEDSQWGDIFANWVHANTIYLRKSDGTYISLLDVLAVTSTDVTHNGETVTDIFNRMYNTSGSTKLITLDGNISISPAKGGNYIKTNASSFTVTISETTNIPIGGVISFSNFGGGSLTISAGGGVTFKDDAQSIVAVSVTLMLVASNAWVINGDYT